MPTLTLRHFDAISLLMPIFSDYFHAITDIFIFHCFHSSWLAKIRLQS